VLRRIFGPKKDEVTGEWRRLHNKELYALYSSPNIFRRQKRASYVTRMGESRGAYRVLVGKPEGITLYIWKDNITMDLGEVAREALAGSIWLRTRIGGGLL
jgi:hypothetical protein